MIIVKVEVWPFGEESEAKEIGRMRIWNRANHTVPGVANYKFQINPLTDGEIAGHVDDHQRARGVWVLLQHCLESVKEEL